MVVTTAGPRWRFGVLAVTTAWLEVAILTLGGDYGGSEMAMFAFGGVSSGSEVAI